jgi:hypothetical protein
VRAILSILRAALFGWATALPRMIRAVCQRVRSLLTSDRGHVRPAAQTTCVPIQDPAFVTPDPLIYSQRFLAAHGLNYSWNNPDIRLFLDGAPVDSHQLRPDTRYNVVVRVWNNSLDCPVVAMPVRLSYLSFGVGTVSHPIGTGQVDVGVKGGPGYPAFVTLPWRTPAEPAHYCLQALLGPVADLDYDNNLGQHNTNVVEARSPAVFSFLLRNDTQHARTYRFAIDTYQLGTPPPCDTAPTTRPDMPARHAQHQPLPQGWTARLTPDIPSLDPDATITVTATVNPPDGWTGSQVVNIHAFYRDIDVDHLAGGVTVTVTGS